MKWADVTREDVLEAIRRFLVHAPEHPAAKNTFLLHEGRQIPAKHIRGMAYEIHFGEKAHKSDFTGGKETADFFLHLGFSVRYKGEVLSPGEKVDAKLHPVRIPVKVPQKFRMSRELAERMERHDCARAALAAALHEKIRIPVQGVTEQKNAMQRLLNKIFDGDVVCEKKFSWMKTPDAPDGIYKAVTDALSAYRGNRDFARKGKSLLCDFVIESQKLIIEYDERQHFSEARRVALFAYLEIPVPYAREFWMRACEDVRAGDNQPPDRDETRAYYDSVRDIEAFRHGYRLVRVMHGAIDFTRDNAEAQLRTLLCAKKKEPLQIGLYLQTWSFQGEEALAEAVAAVKASDLDILVFPECGWFPFVEDFESLDMEEAEDREEVSKRAISFSGGIGCAVVLCAKDANGARFSVYANAFASGDDTPSHIYIKHTATSYSAFEFRGYRDIAEKMFEPIRCKGWRIGLTICYDCNHSIFSRIYGLLGIDIILNSTGGHVVREKWRKYNKTRAIENHCFAFVTMGSVEEKGKDYVFGFDREGGGLPVRALRGDAETDNVPGTIYVYDVSEDVGAGDADPAWNQRETISKHQTMNFPVGGSEALLRASKRIKKGLYIKPCGDENLVIVVADGDDIMRPEKHLPLLYDAALKAYGNKRYLLLCRYGNLDEAFYREKLSVLLKVRAVENYCAVVLESDAHMDCFQTNNERLVQAVKPVHGFYGLDATRMKGPELIWRDRWGGMKASWRENLEWLIGEMAHIGREGRRA